MRRRLALLLLALGATACASTGAVPRPFPSPRGGGSTLPARPAPTVAARASGYAVAGTALALRGAPYRDGGADPGGFDCSGFVQYVFAQHALPLPRAVSDQFRAGRSVDPSDVAPGDLIFFSTVAPGPTHVGIVLGGDEFVHAPSGRGEVRVERLSAPYWSKRLVGVRRVL